MRRKKKILRTFAEICMKDTGKYFNVTKLFQSTVKNFQAWIFLVKCKKFCSGSPDVSDETMWITITHSTMPSDPKVLKVMTITQNVLIIIFYNRIFYFQFIFMQEVEFQFSRYFSLQNVYASDTAAIKECLFI